MPREKLAHTVLLLAVFLLPWQTRWMFLSVPLNGQPWEYGQLSLYATECLLVLAWILFGRLRLSVPARQLIQPSFAILAAACFSGAFSSFPLISAGAIIHLASAFLLFFLLCDERVSITNVLSAFVAGLAIPSALGWWQGLTGTSPASSWLGLASHLAATPGVSVVGLPDGTRVLRAYGTLPHPNVFGGFVVVGLWSLYALFERSGRGREWLVIPGMLLGSALILSFSRSAWLAAAVGAMYWAGTFLRRRQLPSKDHLLAIGGVIIAIAATGFLFRDSLQTRADADAPLERKSVAERQAGYEEFVDVVRTNPVTGVGIGAYTGALAAQHPDHPVYADQPVHNALALLFAETGLLGLFAFVWFFKRIFPSLTAPTLFMLIGLTILDHYLWSLWAGLALTAFVFAMSLRRLDASVRIW